MLGSLKYLYRLSTVSIWLANIQAFEIISDTKKGFYKSMPIPESNVFCETSILY